MIFNKKGIAFPNYQNKLAKIFLNANNHDRQQWEFCFSKIKNFRTCLDFGGHVGITARLFSTHFSNVVSFEPIPELFECLKYNTKDLDNIKIHNVAISDVNDFTDIFVNPENSGSNVIESVETDKLIDTRWRNKKRQNFVHMKPITVETKTIDSFNFTDVDFIKIDTEGFNIKPLMGMSNTLKINSPVIIMEKGQTENLGNKFLTNIGYKLIRTIGIDEIYVREQ
jgi:FkbM family methyltransferase